MRFEGRVALITGASTGIGLATINRLILEGCRVFGAHRRKAAEIDIGRATSVHLDVTNELNWNAAIDQVLAEVGRLDILINNAGIRESASIEDTSLSLWHHLIDTNLTSTFLGCRAVVSAMRKGGGGAIVNVGSITGIRGTENMVAYSASKSGIVSFTSSLALDLAPSNIRVNSVCPAAIRTRMVNDMLQIAPDLVAAEAKLLSKHPIGRIGTPEEVASVIAFLASDDSSFMTGLSIPVDGGRSIR